MDENRNPLDENKVQNGYSGENGQKIPAEYIPKAPVKEEKADEWGFNDYGPIDKKSASLSADGVKVKTSNGAKVTAIVMSVLFVLLAASFLGYVVWQNNNGGGNNAIVENNKNGGEDNGNSPSLEISDTPKTEDKELPSGELSGRQIYEKVAPTVVGIAVYTKNSGYYEMLGQGSGVIMSEDGYIITNAHVVTDTTGTFDISKIEVILSDGETYVAELVGADKQTDLAVIKINASGLKYAEFGDSDELMVGDEVFVIGNPSGLKYAGSMTDGRVSALNRDVYMSQLGSTLQYIQTNAAINSGNSGGAFINVYGQVVGITSAKISKVGYEGMGFAIPINNAKPIVDSIIKNGYVTGRVKIGILFQTTSEALAELNGVPYGIRVVDVMEKSDAYNKDIKPGDIITEMDGVAVYDSETIGNALEGKKPGDSITIKIFRVNDEGVGGYHEITCKLYEMKPEDMQ